MEKKETDNRVIIRCGWGLGNQMFFYALYKYLSGRDINVYLDNTWFSLGKVELSYEKYKLENYFNLKEVDIIDDIKELLCFPSLYNMSTLIRKSNLSIKDLLKLIINKSMLKIVKRLKIKYKSKNIIFYEARLNKLPEISSNINYYLVGYFQKYNYCNSIRETLLSDFSFTKPLSEQVREILIDIEKNNAVSIHIRRVGYVTDNSRESFKNRFGLVCTMQYYKNAINYIKSKYTDLKFFLFSDDVDWVRENFSFLDNYYVVDNTLEELSDYYDLFLMTKMKHNIISNGTFAWWGAWLNQNPSKTIIIPEIWTMNENEDSNIFGINELCPPEWIRIPRS
jgi:hypothetical protein